MDKTIKTMSKCCTSYLILHTTLITSVIKKHRTSKINVLINFTFPIYALINIYMSIEKHILNLKKNQKKFKIFKFKI